MNCYKFQTCLVLDCKFQNFQSSVEGKEFQTTYVEEKKISTSFLTSIKSSMDIRNSPSFSERISQILLLSAADKDFTSSELSDHALFHSCLQKIFYFQVQRACNVIVSGVAGRTPKNICLRCDLQFQYPAQPDTEKLEIDLRQIFFGGRPATPDTSIIRVYNQAIMPFKGRHTVYQN